MNGKLKVTILILVLIGIVAVGYFALQNIDKKTTEKELLKKVVTPINGDVVAEKLPKTNPFETNVNPFDSYKNPFGN